MSVTILLLVVGGFDDQLLDWSTAHILLLGDLNAALWAPCFALGTDEYEVQAHAAHKRGTLRAHPDLASDYVVAHDTLAELICVDRLVNVQGRFIDDILHHLIIFSQIV